MRINIPGLEGIDIDEILGRASTIPRPPLNKKRPLPKPVSRPSLEAPEIPKTINIPGVGPIQLPQAVKPPASIAPETLDNWWINEGPKTLPGPRPEIQIPDDPYAGYRDREDDDEEDTPPADFQSPSEYLSEQEWENVTTPNPSLTEEQLRQLYTSGMMDFDDDYFTDTEGMFGEAGQRYGLGVPQDRIDEIAQEINFSSNQSEPAPAPTPAPTPPPKPAVNPFKDYVPRNILGQSFDPKDLSAHKKMVQDARNRLIVPPGEKVPDGGYLTYDNPILGNKQTQFGGYGQPMPTKPLMNYAGLASPVTYSTPDPDPDKEIIR